MLECVDVTVEPNGDYVSHQELVRFRLGSNDCAEDLDRAVALARIAEPKLELLAGFELTWRAD